METSIKVNYQSTSLAYTANQWLRSLSDKELIAADFEAAIKYTDDELASFKSELSTTTDKLRSIELKSRLAATALDHPSHSQLTHLSIAWSDSDAYVFILDNKRITDLVTNWLVTTPIKQVWHNASYDFKWLYHLTGRFPINYEDSQLLAKSILNHVNTYKATVGLKELAGKWYGQWSISADFFSVSELYNPDVLLYSATDACATYKLWHSINNYVSSTKDPACSTHSAST